MLTDLSGSVEDTEKYIQRLVQQSTHQLLTPLGRVCRPRERQTAFWSSLLPALSPPSPGAVQQGAGRGYSSATL